MVRELKNIWVLLDERQGNSNQSIGVAEALGLPFTLKNIRFTGAIRLPNSLLHRHLLAITPESRAQLTPPWPDMVIATARRLSVVASYIKHKNPSTFLLQVQWPGFPSQHFDLLVPPLHDEVREARNIYRTLGATHRVNETLLQQEATRWQPHFSHMKTPRFALLLGGASRRKDFAAHHAAKLAAQVSQLVNAHGGSLLITTSRRTGTELTEQLIAALTCPHYLHQWDDADPANNPYLGLLGLAEAIIVTGDSVSMCSEACATGKPVLIYAAADFVSGKYRDFHQRLYEGGYARPLSGKPLADLFSITPTRLNDMQPLAGQIIRRLS